MFSESNISLSLTASKEQRLKDYIDALGKKGITLVAGGKRIRLFTDKHTKDKNIFSKKGRTDKEVNARIKNIPDFEKIIKGSEYDYTDENIRDVEKEAKKGVIAIHHFKTSVDGFDVDIVIRDKGKKQFLYEVKFINKKSSQQSSTDKTARPAPYGDVENGKTISHQKNGVKRESKIISAEHIQFYEDKTRYLCHAFRNGGKRLRRRSDTVFKKSEDYGCCVDRRRTGTVCAC